MVNTTSAPSLASNLKVYCAQEPILSDATFLIAYGPSATPSSSIAGSTSTSRIQAHIFSPNGYQAYPRLAISPTSSLYTAVNCLPRDDQGDEVCRALAYTLNKYFSELSEDIKSAWLRSRFKNPKHPTLCSPFSDSHAAALASRMVEVHNPEPIVQDLTAAFSSAAVSYCDVDLFLPAGSVKDVQSGRDGLDTTSSLSASAVTRYGQHAELVELFGETAFIPTSRVRRAPSKPTAVNRLPNFTRDKKEALRRELCEFVDTEHSYVAKLEELVQTIALRFREVAAERRSHYATRLQEAAANLFPPSLDQIAKVNNEFLTACEQTLVSTESAAIRDIEFTNPDSTFEPEAIDLTGAGKFADCLLDWLPRFASCYGSYMKAHAAFATYLQLLTADPSSDYAKLVQDIGEQKLTSALIEPIQRLPRYSLYIDNITSQLPIRHPALKKFLRSKDVISDICAQDEPSNERTVLLNRLKTLISGWPPSLTLSGRLITTVDLTQLRAPFDVKSHDCVMDSFVMLIFAKEIILIRKSNSSAITARGLLAEVDSVTVHKPGQSDLGSKHVEFYEHISLETVRFETLSDGLAIRMIPVTPAQNFKPVLSFANSISHFAIGGAYESKAGRFLKDIAKARVEGRYSEAERDSARWEARDLDRDDLGLGLFTAISERQQAHEVVRGAPATVQIRLEASPDDIPQAAFRKGIKHLALVSNKGQGFYELEMMGDSEHRTRDIVTASEFLPVFIKRLSNQMQMQAQLSNNTVDSAFLLHHEEILQSLKLPVKQRGRSESRAKSLRPLSHSPVKALTSLFTRGDDVKSTGGSLAQIPSLRPPMRAKSQSELRSKPLPASPIKATIFGHTEGSSLQNSSTLLEDTLATYILALTARKGNVVGRSIANRGFADEAVVNELYNALLEDATNHDIAAQAPVDVLFAAFEKFLKIAWKEQLGPVLDLSTLKDMQGKSESLSPYDYEDYLVTKIEELSPQNQRAVKAVIGLLVNLLEGMSNDGDRGALMAAITQIIVCDGDSHDFISLFDRFVEEQDVILLDFSRSRHATPASLASSLARSTYTGSVSSKASSFSKRLGLGSIHRENSKNEPPSRLGSVLRTLSKTGRRGDTTRSILNRTHSVELDAHSSTLVQANPQGRVKAIDAFVTPSSESLGDAVNGQANKAEEFTKPLVTSKVKKKRRSSLSDLELLPTPNMSPMWTSPAFQGTGNLPRLAHIALKSPESPLPKKQTEELTGSPIKSSALRPRILKRKETDPSGLPTAEVKQNMMPDETVVKRPSATPPGDMAGSPSRQVRPLSGISAVRGVLSERQGNAGSGITTTSVDMKSSEAPLMPSPKKNTLHPSQKLQDRMSRQKDAIVSAETSLQKELEKIGQEMSAMKIDRNNSTASNHSASTKTDQNPHLLQLNTRVKALETKYGHLLRNLGMHVNALENDVTTTLTASERKTKALEAKLKDADTENDLLFQRNNEELGKLFKRVKEGQGLEEMKRKLKEAQDEATKLRKENATLKTEVVSLRAIAGE